MEEYGRIDETHGVLSVSQIGEICGEVFPEYQVDYCYLFGSYAKGKETDISDVDLLVSMPLNGIKYYELLEVIRTKLRKKVDLIDVNQLTNNP